MARQLNGIFAVYKSVGVTSADVTNSIKGIIRLGLREQDRGLFQCDPSRSIQRLKVGHGGTLDYDASGVLVVGIGGGTKQLGEYLQGTKKYVATGLLGTATDTHSQSGAVTEASPYEHVTAEQFLAALNKYHGQIQQVPPIYSALKFRGHTMSSLVRAGVPVSPKPARTVDVEDIRCVRFQPPEFTLEITCGGGFYVRKLIHDLGRDLDTCACMASLERTAQGPFRLGENVLLADDLTYPRIAEVLRDFQLPNR